MCRTISLYFSWFFAKGANELASVEAKDISLNVSPTLASL